MVLVGTSVFIQFGTVKFKFNYFELYDSGLEENNLFLSWITVSNQIQSQKVVKSKRSGFLVSDFVISVEISVNIRYGIVKF